MTSWPDFTLKNFLLIASAMLFYSVSVKANAWQVLHKAELDAAGFMDRWLVHGVTGVIEMAFIACLIIFARRR